MQAITSAGVSAGTGTSARSRAAAEALGALAAGLLGALLLWVVGFSNVDSIHNAAHDTRHQNAFPCH